MGICLNGILKLWRWRMEYTLHFLKFPSKTFLLIQGYLLYSTLNFFLNNPNSTQTHAERLTRNGSKCFQVESFYVRYLGLLFGGLLTFWFLIYARWFVLALNVESFPTVSPNSYMICINLPGILSNHRANKNDN